MHHGPGVGSVAGDGRRGAAGVAVVAVAGVVVVARITRREGGRGIVVEDQGLTGVGGEIDDHVRPFGRSHEQRMQIDIAGVEHGRIVYPCGRLGRDNNRCRQEPTFVTDLDPFRPLGVGQRRGEDRRVI